MDNDSISLQLDQLNMNDEDDDDIEDRQNEIHGLLSTAFDDLSSLSDEDDNENSFEFAVENQRSENDLLEAKRCWEMELREDIDVIIDVFKNREKPLTKTNGSDVNLKCLPLKNLLEVFQDCCDVRENFLLSQLSELRETKTQLEIEFNEYKAQNSNNSLTNSPNNSLYRELKIELEKVSEEANIMKHKLQKYKLYYHQLVRKHKNEIDCIKRELANILRCAEKNLCLNL